MVKGVIKYLSTFIVTLLLLTSLLMISACIPRSAIKQNVIKTADFLCEKPSIFPLIPGISASTVDRYADAILMSVVYCWDEKNPFESVLWSRFYGEYSRTENELFRESLLNEYEPNQEYLRYWHGSGIFLRFYHLFWSLREIYYFNGAIMGVLIIWLLRLLWKNNLKGEAIATGICFSTVSIWFVPFCLEYTWVFLIMLAASIFTVKMSVAHKLNRLGDVFLIIGMTTAFLDFLTAETVTLIIPLLLTMRLWETREKRRIWEYSVKSATLWFFGYSGMWIMKWILAGVMLKQNVLPYVTGHIEERIGKYIGLSLPQYLQLAVLKNLIRISPLQYGLLGGTLFILAVFTLLFIPVILNRVALRKYINGNKIAIYALIGLIPYVRYLILHNHAVQHSFFTYRAQAASILALCFIILELIEPVRKAVNPHGSDNPHALPE